METNIKKKVLVVDDEKAFVELAKDFLELEGIEVRVLMDSTQVLREVVSWRPDVLVLDLNMPDLSGFEVLEQIRVHADPQIKKLPVVIVSVVAEEAERVGSLVGTAAVFSKPMDYADWSARIKKIAQGQGLSNA